MKKQLLAWLLAVCLLAGCVPLGAWADEQQGDPPKLGMVGFADTTEKARNAIKNNWNLSDEQINSAFTQAHADKTNWMWAGLPHDDESTLNTYKIELSQADSQILDSIDFSDSGSSYTSIAKGEGSPFIVIWWLNEDVQFPQTGVVTAKLYDVNAGDKTTPLGSSEVVRAGEQTGPGPGGPQYPEGLEIEGEIDYSGMYGELDLKVTFNQEVGRRPYYFKIVETDKPSEVLASGPVGRAPDETGFGPNQLYVVSSRDKMNQAHEWYDSNFFMKDPFPFSAGRKYTLSLYRVEINGQGEVVKVGDFITSKSFTMTEEIGNIYVCAKHTEKLGDFVLSQIVNLEADNKNKVIKITGTVVSAEDYLNLTVHTFKPTGARKPTPDDWMSGTYIRLERQEDGKYTVAPDMMIGDHYGWINHINTWLTPVGEPGYTLVSEVESERPTLNEETKAATSAGTAEEDVKTVLEALNTNEGKSAVSIENSEEILRDAAAENITQADADQAIYELTKYQPVDNLTPKARTAPTGPSKTSIVAKTSLDVNVKSANLTGTSKSIKLDITPKAQVVATAKGIEGEAPLAGFDQPKELEVKSKVNLTIPLPEGFAAEGQTLYIKHKGHVYEGTVEGDKVTFTNPDGFSEFEILTEKPAEPVAPPSGGGNTSTTPAPKDEVTTTPTVSGGTANSTLSSSQGASLVEAAKQPSTGEVTVKIEPKEDVTAANVTLPVSTVTGVGAAKADLKIETPVADITLPGEALTGLGSGASSVTVSAAVNDDKTVSIDVKKDNTTVTSLPQPMKAAIPAPDITDTTVAVLVNEDGAETIIPKSISGKDEISLLLGGSAKIKLKDNSKAFNDTKDHWADNDGSIDFATSRELFQGVSDASFAPAQPMTRGMMVTVLHRLESKPKGSMANFTDIPDGAYYAEAVAWGNEKGIVQGTGANSFTPNQNVTREQLATFLYRYASKYGVDTAGRTSLTSFPDSGNVSGYAKDAMEWTYHTGLIKGTDNGRLDPTGSATRGQVAAILMRFVEYINK